MQTALSEYFDALRLRLEEGCAAVLARLAVHDRTASAGRAGLADRPAAVQQINDQAGYLRDRHHVGRYLRDRRGFVTAS